MKIHPKLILFFVLLSPAVVSGQTSNELRRIEETKRESLRSTETKEHDAKIPEKEHGRLNVTYFNELLEKPFATNEDVAYVFMTLLGEIDQYSAFEDQKRFIVENGFLSQKAANGFLLGHPAKRGGVAYLFLKGLGIKGGITLRLFGPSEHYAIKELVHEGIMFSGSKHEPMSGRELIIILTQSAEFLSVKMADQ